RPKISCQRPLNAQSVYAWTVATGPVQWESTRRHDFWAGSHGEYPRFGSSSCHDWSAHSEPSDALHPTRKYGSFGPLYGLHGVRNVGQTTLWYVPQPPE